MSFNTDIVFPDLTFISWNVITKITSQDVIKIPRAKHFKKVVEIYKLPWLIIHWAKYPNWSDCYCAVFISNQLSVPGIIIIAESWNRISQLENITYVFRLHLVHDCWLDSYVSETKLIRNKEHKNDSNQTSFSVPCGRRLRHARGKSWPIISNLNNHTGNLPWRGMSEDTNPRVKGQDTE